MSDSSAKSGENNNENQKKPVFTAKEDARRELTRAEDEAHWARVRFQAQSRVIGYHGENFDGRSARVRRIVTKFTERAVERARKNALHAGWAHDELVAPKRFTTD